MKSSLKLCLSIRNLGSCDTPRYIKIMKIKSHFLSLRYIKHSISRWLDNRRVIQLLLGALDIAFYHSTMDPYDSDSSGLDDDENYTETAVLLGYSSTEPTGDSISQLGGWPVCRFDPEAFTHILPWGHELTYPYPVVV